MIKLDKWDGTKSYMLMTGEPLDSERIKSDYPFGLMATSVIETDEESTFFFNFWNLKVLRYLYAIKSTLTEDEAIAEIEYKMNNSPKSPLE